MCCLYQRSQHYLMARHCGITSVEGTFDALLLVPFLALFSESYDVLLVMDHFPIFWTKMCIHTCPIMATLQFRLDVLPRRPG